MSKSSDNLFADALKAKAGAAEPVAESAEGTKAAETQTAATPATAEPEATPAAAPATQSAPELEIPDEDPEPEVSELDMLKSRARLMNITFSNNIGVEALRAKIQAKLDDEQQPEEDEEEPEVANETEAAQQTPEGQAALNAAANATAAAAPAAQTAPAKPVNPKLAARRAMYEEQMRLVRVRITNLNPNKKDLPGEIFTVANKVLGTVRKFIPYGEATDNGYHIPFFIYQQLKEREFQLIKVTKDSKGREKIETRMAREFALEVLPALTEAELARLAASQAAAAGTD